MHRQEFPSRTLEELSLKNISSIVNNLDEIISNRRHFHQYPEGSFKEFNTANYIAEKLRSYGGITVWENVAKTGVVGLISGGGSGPCIALRADMDALPVSEKNSKWNKQYKSKDPDMMHACGHDGHMAMLLGAARILNDCRHELIGSIKLLFQPAEEGLAGAKVMVEEGVLDEGRFGPRVDEVYGIHLIAPMPLGVVSIADGPIMAASDFFTITVHGKGGHGAVPDATIDPVYGASVLVTQLQSIVSRNISPLDTAVVSVCSIQGGRTYNVIPDHVTLLGTVRHFSVETKAIIKKRMKEICNGLQSMNLRVELKYEDGYPVTDNASKVHVNKVRIVAQNIVGHERVIAAPKVMGAEDFSFFLNERPGCFWWVGCSPAEKDEIPPQHHNSSFDLDERALVIGTSMFVSLIKKILKKGISKAKL